MLTLHADQTRAIEMATTKPLMVLTGPPGSGKTTVSKCVIEALEKQGEKVVIIGSTGKSVMVLQTTLGNGRRCIYTLDKILGSDKIVGKYQNASILVDETSMVSTVKLHALLKSLRPQRLILVGDANQLPPVNGCNILADLVSLPTIPCVSLTRIWRQTGQTALSYNIALIRENTVLTNLSDLRTDENFKILPFIDWATRIKTIASTEWPLPQFLCYTQATRSAINKAVQEIIHPRETCFYTSDKGVTKYYPGDPVICTKNDYDVKTKDKMVVSNGSKGIVQYNESTRQIEIVYSDPRFVDVRGEHGYFKTRFELAYCLTVHKAQGDQFKHVVIVVDAKSYLNPPRSLLYTAISRAKTSCWIVCDSDQLERATRVHVNPITDFVENTKKQKLR